MFVIDSFLPWQSGNTEQFISFQSVFLCSFQQGLTPEVAAPKAAAAADKKHSSVPHCNGDSLFVYFERIFMLQCSNTIIQAELVAFSGAQVPDVLCVFCVSGDSSEQTKAPKVSQHHH